MTNDAPIGMFDSGIGGLTIAKALLERLPHGVVALCGGHGAHALRGQES